MKISSIIKKEKDGSHQRGFIVLEISVWLYLNHFHHTSVTQLQTPMNDPGGSEFVQG